MLGGEDRDVVRFRTFALEAEPRLHTAFIAKYGHEEGREATAEAMAWAWEHWERVQAMSNPVGYLFRVGQSKVRKRKTPVVFARPEESEVFVEPALAQALARLPERQRLAVLLVQGEGCTLKEVADLLGVSVATVQRHVERGMSALRRALRVDTNEGHR